MGTAIKHPVPERVSFVIFDIWALRRSGLSVECPDVKNYKFNPVWHRMLYSCTHMATVGVKGLNNFTTMVNFQNVNSVSYASSASFLRFFRLCVNIDFALGSDPRLICWRVVVRLHRIRVLDLKPSVSQSINRSINRSINQSKHIYIVPHVMSESEIHDDGN